MRLLDLVVVAYQADAADVGTLTDSLGGDVLATTVGHSIKERAQCAQSKDD